MNVDEYEKYLERGGRRRASANRIANLFSGGMTGAGVVGGGCLIAAVILGISYGITCLLVWLAWWLLAEAFPTAIAYPTQAQVMLVALVVWIVGALQRGGGGSKS